MFFLFFSLKKKAKSFDNSSTIMLNILRAHVSFYRKHVVDHLFKNTIGVSVSTCYIFR